MNDLLDADVIEDHAYTAEQVGDLLQYMREDLEEVENFSRDRNGVYPSTRFRLMFTLLTIAQEKAEALQRDLTQLAEEICDMQAKEKASNSVTALNEARK